MKKSLFLVFALFVTTTFFAGCFSGEEAASEAVPIDAAKQEAAKLTEDTFVALSAEILCLPTNFPEAKEAEITEKANALATKYGVTEADYEAYQKKVEADKQEKTRVGYAIIAKMSDFCQIAKTEDLKPETTDAASKAEDSSAPTDSKTEKAPNTEDAKAAEGTIAPEVAPAPAPTSVPAQ